jgi:hypothetical protein
MGQYEMVVTIIIGVLFYPEHKGSRFLQKCWYLSEKLHGITTKKMTIFIFAV